MEIVEDCCATQKPSLFLELKRRSSGAKGKKGNSPTEIRTQVSGWR